MNIRLFIKILDIFLIIWTLKCNDTIELNFSLNVLNSNLTFITSIKNSQCSEGLKTCTYEGRFNLKRLCSQMPELPAAIYGKLFRDPVPKIIAFSRWLIHSASDSILTVMKKMGLWEELVNDSHNTQLPLICKISAMVTPHL